LTDTLTDEAEFLQDMERRRTTYEAKIIEAAIGWVDNLTSMSHAHALQEAVIRLRTFDRDEIRKYIKKFDVPADDGFAIYLAELEEKLG
jgi:hypothetical protein